jgi:hypothetical protein
MECIQLCISDVGEASSNLQLGALVIFHHNNWSEPQTSKIVSADQFTTFNLARLSMKTQKLKGSGDPEIRWLSMYMLK